MKKVLLRKELKMLKRGQYPKFNPYEHMCDVKITKPLKKGWSATYYYNPKGKPVYYTDDSGRTKEWRYDDDGDCTYFRESDMYEIHYEYYKKEK